jgi:hypothetical protein
MAPPLKTANGQGAGPETVVVYSKAEHDEIGVETLVGEYVEAGTNHDRKFYKRKRRDGDGGINVSLYYWDARDGADFAGWWFGESVGGAQVWSRCATSAQQPPTTGWCIPWDGDVCHDLGVEVRKSVAPAGKKAIVKQEPKEITKKEIVEEKLTLEQEECVQRATDRVIIAEIEASQILESVSAMLEGDVTDSALRATEELLKIQQTALTEVHKVLAAEIMEARKQTPKLVAALRKLTPRLRCVSASVAQEVAKAKSLAAAKGQDEEDQRSAAKDRANKAQAESSDAKALEDSLPGLIDQVAQAEDLLTTCASTAAPLLDEFKEDLSDAVTAIFDDVEKAANKAETAIKSARQQVSLKMTAAKKLAPKAQRVALAEYSALQEKLMEAEKTLSPYLCMRKEHGQKLEAKKAMTEADKSLSKVEGEVEKLLGLLTSPKAGEDELKKIEAVISPVETSISSALKFVEQRIEHAKGKFKEELLQMQSRGKAARVRIAEFRQKLQTQAASLKLNLVLQQGLDKTLAVEELLVKMTIAEEPLLKGDLPNEEAPAVIKICEEAAQKVELEGSQAKTFLKACLEDSHKFPSNLQATVKEELAQLQFRLDAVAQKVASFKRENATRKASLLLGEVVVKVVDAEGLVAKAVEVAAVISAQDIEASSVESLRALTTQTLESEKVAGLACAEARKVLSMKQKQAQGKDSSPVYAAELSKLATRLSGAAQELQKIRSLVLTAEKSWKNKELLQDNDAELKKIEDEIARVEILTTPLGGDGPTDEEVMEMDVAVGSVQKWLAKAVAALEPAKESMQGPAMASLSKLLARVAKAQTQLAEVIAQSREMRERVQCDQILREAKEKLSKVDDAFERASDAEAPYMKGLEVLPMEEASRALSECEAAAAAVQQAIGEARSFLADKSLALRKFLDVVGRSGLVEIGTMSEKNEAALSKLADFRKETHKRKGRFLIEELVAQITAAEEAVQKTILKTAPLAAQDVEAIAPEVAQELCEKLGESEKEARGKLELARKSLAERQKDSKASHDPAEIAKLVTRLTNAQTDLAKAKSTASEHEQRFVARILNAEIEEMRKDLNNQLDSATGAAAPLIVEGGKTFVVASMAKMIFEALRDHAKQNNLTMEAILGGKESEEKFVTFLEEVPQLCSRPDLAFSSEQRHAVFEYVDVDSKGSVSCKAFLSRFREKLLCVHSTTITDGFDVSTSQTLAKLEPGDIVLGMSEPKIEELSGITRVKVQKDSITGWVTIQGNKGTPFVESLTDYASFMRDLNKTLDSSLAKTKAAIAFITQKHEELRECKKGPLAETKAALTKFRPQVSVVQAKLDQLKKQIEEGKREHQKREEFEKKKQEEKKQKSLADAAVKGITEKIGETDAAVKEMEKSLAPLLDAAAKPTPHPTAAPVSMRKAVEGAAKRVETLAAAAADALKASMSRHIKASSGPWVRAMEEMGQLQETLVGLEAKVNALLESADGACDTIGSGMLGVVTVALQAALKKKKTTIDKVFADLGGDGADGVTEAKVSEYLDSLKAAKFSPEQMQLLFKQVSSHGVISRHRFKSLFARFLLCVKEVAVTADFDIQVDSSDERKLVVGEAVEIIEGPKKDDTLGLIRYRVKALADGREGWVSARGNEGTVFMKSSGKPCLYATKPVSIQDDIIRDSAKTLKVLGTHEVIELLEGPRKESDTNVSRAKAKTADGIIGWFTFKDAKGQESAGPGKACYVTKSTIALTDGVNIKDCKVLRKLDKGESLVCIEGPMTDDTAGVTRIKVTANKDGKEGWVTTKGNAGSLYAEESGRMYTMLKSTALQEGFESDCKTLLTIDAGANIELLEGPIDEKPDAAIRVKGLATSSGQVGWLTMEGGNLRPWGPRYRCVNSTAINDIMDVASENAQTLRKLEVGETVELLEGPRLEADVGIVRLRGRAEKDGVVGWMSIAGNQGKPFLKVALDQ